MNGRDSSKEEKLAGEWGTVDSRAGPHFRGWGGGRTPGTEQVGGGAEEGG